MHPVLHDPNYLAADIAGHLQANLVHRAGVVVIDHCAYYVFAVELDYVSPVDDDFETIAHFFGVMS